MLEKPGRVVFLTPALERQRRLEPQTLSSQTSLLGEFQASENLCLERGGRDGAESYLGLSSGLCMCKPTHVPVHTDAYARPTKRKATFITVFLFY